MDLKTLILLKDNVDVLLLRCKDKSNETIFYVVKGNRMIVNTFISIKEVNDILSEINNFRVVIFDMSEFIDEVIDEVIKNEK